MYKFNLNDIRPNIVGKTNENPPWRHNGRRTDYNHLLVVTDGECTLGLGDKIRRLVSHDLVIIPANEFYRLKTDTHCEYSFVCFYADCDTAGEEDMKICEAFLPTPDMKFFIPPNTVSSKETICLPEYIRLDGKIYSDINTLFIKLRQLNSTGKYLDYLLINVYFREILLLLSEHTFNKAVKEHPRTLEKLMLYINEKYTEHITAETLSEIFELSKEHICGLFSSAFNMTVSEYVNSVRLRHATELLSNSFMNITQIAEYLGFSSIHYFSRIFKKVYGVPPTKYSVL